MEKDFVTPPEPGADPARPLRSSHGSAEDAASKPDSSPPSSLDDASLDDLMAAMNRKLGAMASGGVDSKSGPPSVVPPERTAAEMESLASRLLEASIEIAEGGEVAPEAVERAKDPASADEAPESVAETKPTTVIPRPPIVGAASKPSSASAVVAAGAEKAPPRSAAERRADMDEVAATSAVLEVGGTNEATNVASAVPDEEPADEAPARPRQQTLIGGVSPLLESAESRSEDPDRSSLFEVTAAPRQGTRPGVGTHAGFGRDERTVPGISPHDVAAMMAEQKARRADASALPEAAAAPGGVSVTPDDSADTASVQLSGEGSPSTVASVSVAQGNPSSDPPPPPPFPSHVLRALEEAEGKSKQQAASEPASSDQAAKDTDDAATGHHSAGQPATVGPVDTPPGISEDVTPDVSAAEPAPSTDVSVAADDWEIALSASVRASRRKKLIAGGVVVALGAVVALSFAAGSTPVAQAPPTEEASPPVEQRAPVAEEPPSSEPHAEPAAAGESEGEKEQVKDVDPGSLSAIIGLERTGAAADCELPSGKTKPGGEAQAAAELKRGRKSLARGNPEEALGAFCTALQKNPKNTSASISLVQTYLLLDDAEHAKAAAEAALERHPKSSKVKEVLGDALARRGDVDEAVEVWLEHMKLGPRDTAKIDKVAAKYVKLAERALKAADRAQAERLFRRAALLNQKLASASVGLARVLLEGEQTAASVAWAKRAVGIDAKNAAAHVALGDALEKAGKGDEARASYEKALEIDPQHERAKSRTSGK